MNISFTQCKRISIRVSVALGAALSLAVYLGADNAPSDPGVCGGPANVGGPIAGLTGAQLAVFQSTLDEFIEVQSVSGTENGQPGAGLGPSFNLNSCGGCHAQPSVGGSSPAVNPQVHVATLSGANNTVPSFITLHGPVREARFVKNRDGSPDGGVHGIFTIGGRYDAPGCDAKQPDFAREIARDNVVFRIPTPVFGDGLIENIPDSAILANKNANAGMKSSLGISGRENRNGNDGTITRFGWKAQNKSLFIFSGEAYNVEQGVTNEAFPTERDSAPGCQFNGTPEDHTDLDTGETSGTQNFTTFMRLLAAPTPAPLTQTANAGQSVFSSIGCALCHTPSFTTGASDFPGLANQPVNLYSDLLVHNMGSRLADGIQQGLAQGNEFRTAPLWGLGKRIFFLHDGRTKDLVDAIRMHRSQGSEANGVINRFDSLNSQQQQHLLNFLRSL